MCKSDYLKKMSHRIAVAAAIGLSVMLTACGGGKTADVNSDVSVTTSAQQTTSVTNVVTEAVTTETVTDVPWTTEVQTEAATEAATEPVTEVPTEPVTEAPTQPKKTVICLDPGHGGESQGTHYVYDGKEIEEKNLNYYIALRLKKYLEQYDNIEVVIDRGENEDPSFENRIAYARDNNADYIVSLHNNSKSRDDIEPSGCMAITTCSHYQAESAVNNDIYGSSRQLALSILSQLKGIGLSVTIDWDANKTNGILQRVGAGTYPDGSECDYYGLIRNATYAGIPSVIIEHAFLSNERDYRKYLSSNAKLDALAKADAAGIMNYLNAN